MKDQMTQRSLRDAIYTRVSTEQGLEQDFNSLDAQREACGAYIKSQAHEGYDNAMCESFFATLECELGAARAA
jgi:DNA invertase Pin-like site-specific DNA recombinase